MTLKNGKRLLALLLVALLLVPVMASASEPIDPPVTLKVGMSRLAAFQWEGSETMEDNVWRNLYKENGINLEILYEVNEEAAREKLTQLIMSGGYPDVVSIPAASFLDWVNQGLFTDISDLYAAVTSEQILDYYGTELGQNAMRAAMVDGKLYGFPMVSDPYDNMSVLWVRNDWLKNLDLEQPKTIDEFIAVAKAFTEGDPDGNGKNDTYGFGVNGATVFHNVGGLNRYFEMFGCVPGNANGSIPFIDVDGKAVYGGALEENMKEGLAVLNDMYNAGYIPKDFITAGVDQVRQDASSGRIGMYFGSMSGANNVWFNAIATQPDAEFVALPVPGRTAETNGTGFYSTTPFSFFALSSKCPYPEAFMRVVELSIKYLAQPDTLSQEEFEMYNGKPGSYTGWQTALVNIAVPLKNLRALERQQAALAGDTSLLNAENWRDFEAISGYFEMKDRDYTSLSEEEIAIYKQGIFYYSVWGAPQCSYAAIQEMITNDRLIRSAYGTVQTENMIRYASTLETLTKETLINIITGDMAVDAYGDFLATWGSLGGTTITEEADAWFQSVK